MKGWAAVMLQYSRLLSCPGNAHVGPAGVTSHVVIVSKLATLVIQFVNLGLGGLKMHFCNERQYSPEKLHIGPKGSSLNFQ